MTRTHIGAPGEHKAATTHPVESYTEKYTTPWRTIFGLTDQIKVTPAANEYQLANYDTVKQFKTPTFFKGISNVDWVFHNCSGDSVVQLADEAQTRVHLPLGGVQTGVVGASKAVGVQKIEGTGGFHRYHFDYGQTMDVLPHEPNVGIIRQSDRITEISDQDGKWKTVNIIFEKDKFPVVTTSRQESGFECTEMPRSSCIGTEGPLPVHSSKYPNGLLTKWGLALERNTYWTGHSLMKIADGSKEGMWIELDAAGNKVVRAGQGIAVQSILEPAHYPRIES